MSDTSLVQVAPEEQDKLIRKSLRDVLSEEVEALASLGEQTIKSVEDQQTIEKVTKDWRTIRDSRIGLDKRRKDIKQPYLEICKAIDSTANDWKEKLQNAEGNLKKQLDWVDSENERIKKALIDSRVRQLEDAGFETADVDGETCYVAGSLAIAHSSLSRYGDARFEKEVRKGVKILVEIRAEEERKRREAEEERRRQEAEARAEEERKRKEEAECLKANPPEETEAPPPDTFRNPLGRTVDAAPQEKEPAPQPNKEESAEQATQKSQQPALTSKQVEAIDGAITALELAWDPRTAFFVRRRVDTKAIELCFAVNPDPSGTIPVPDRVINIPLKNFI